MNSLKVIEYHPRLQPCFEALNKAWLEEYFAVEPINEWVLGNPEEAILQEGGKIYFVEQLGQIIGTVALKPAEPGIYEMTKMAVDKSAQGLGAGKLLCKTAIEQAKALGAQRLILYSETSLKAAIAIYRQMGFQEIPLEPGLYKRANIKMELVLNNSTVA